MAVVPGLIHPLLSESLLCPPSPSRTKTPFLANCRGLWVSLPQYIESNALTLATHSQAEFLRFPCSPGRILIHHLICIIVPPAPNIPQSFLMLKRLWLLLSNTTHPILPFLNSKVSNFISCKQAHRNQLDEYQKCIPLNESHFPKDPSRLNYLPLLCLVSYVSIPAQSLPKSIRALTTDNSLQTGKVIITITLTNTKGFLPTRSKGQVWLLFLFYIFPLIASICSLSIHFLSLNHNYSSHMCHKEVRENTQMVLLGSWNFLLRGADYLWPNILFIFFLFLFLFSLVSEAAYTQSNSAVNSSDP